MTDVPRKHIELYEELCQRMQDKWDQQSLEPGTPERVKLPPFDEWVEDDVELDQVVNRGGIDEVRIVVHNCVDGDGYFWSCGGWYRRDSLFDEQLARTVNSPWELETAFHFGGDGGPRMRTFWQNEDGFLEDDQ